MSTFQSLWRVKRETLFTLKLTIRLIGAQIRFQHMKSKHLLNLLGLSCVTWELLAAGVWSRVQGNWFVFCSHSIDPTVYTLSITRQLLVVLHFAKY